MWVDEYKDTRDVLTASSTMRTLCRIDTTRHKALHARHAYKFVHTH